MVSLFPQGTKDIDTTKTNTPRRQPWFPDLHGDRTANQRRQSTHGVGPNGHGQLSSLAGNTNFSTDDNPAGIDE